MFWESNLGLGLSQFQASITFSQAKIRPMNGPLFLVCFVHSTCARDTVGYQSGATQGTAVRNDLTQGLGLEISLEGLEAWALG